MIGVRGLDVGSWCDLGEHNQALMVDVLGRSGILLQPFSYSYIAGHKVGQLRASGYEDNPIPSASVV